MTKTAQANGDAAALVRKLWQYCNVLRDDGLSYPDYVEQLTYLLFLKLSDEHEDGPVPHDLGWQSLVRLDAEKMVSHYAPILSRLDLRRYILYLTALNTL